jgi:hypothetical protein
MYTWKAWESHKSVKRARIRDELKIQDLQNTIWYFAVMLGEIREICSAFISQVRDKMGR